MVQDAAYMVIVPNVASDTPPLEKNPVFIYSHDRFKEPLPFRPDVVVNIDPVFEQKIDGLDAHVSQFYEWLPWTSRSLDQVPKDKAARKQWLANWRGSPVNAEIKKALEKWYSPEVAAQVKHYEAFQICEYGRRPDDEEIRKLFPMLGTSTPFLKAVKTEGPMKIDGHIDEAAYQQAPRVYLKNSATATLVDDPAYESYAQAVYDDRYLYISFHCQDRDIHSTFTQRDEYLWQQEAVEVFLDTDEEPNNYVELEVSPNNVLFDSYIVQPDDIDIPETLKYNLKQIKTGVQVVGSVNKRKDTDQSWTVEIAIPFEEIVDDFHPDQLKDAIWKINLYRINRDASPLQYLSWSPTQGSFHQPQKFGTIIFR